MQIRMSSIYIGIIKLWEVRCFSDVSRKSISESKSFAESVFDVMIRIMNSK